MTKVPTDCLKFIKEKRIIRMQNIKKICIKTTILDEVILSISFTNPNKVY